MRLFGRIAWSCVASAALGGWFALHAFIRTLDPPGFFSFSYVELWTAASGFAVAMALLLLAIWVKAMPGLAKFALAIVAAAILTLATRNVGYSWESGEIEDGWLFMSRAARLPTGEQNCVEASAFTLTFRSPEHGAATTVFRGVWPLVLEGGAAGPVC